MAPDDWQAAAAGWLTTVRAAERSTLEATIVTADAAAFEAGKSARLYLIGTAAAVILSILLASLLARRINRRLQRLTVAANQLATVETTIAPAKPSHVLPGLMRGIILWRPISEPTAYAPESLNFVTRMK